MKTLSWIFLLTILLSGPSFSKDSNEANEVRKGAEDFIGTVSPLIYGGILESANPYGGFPHFSLGVGLNAMRTLKFTNPVDTTKEVSFPGAFPFLMADIGLFQGISITPLLKGMGALDLLLRWTPVPKIDEPTVTESPQFYSFGLRVGLMKDILTVPGVSFSWRTNKLGTMRFVPQEISPLEWCEFDLRTNSIYLEVSKSLMFATPYVGIGKDWYSLNTTYKEKNEDVKSIEPKIKGSTSRTAVGLKFSLLLLKIYAEIGKYGDKTLFAAGLRAGI